jgi:preprotein translocase SecE subunit
MSKLYKEGQGKWSRSLLVMVVVVGALLALAQLYQNLPNWGTLEIPIIGFAIEARYLLLAPLLVAAVYFAYRLFNHPTTADFLIDTETELKVHVSWPSRKEEVNSSTIVVVTVFVLGIIVFTLDVVFAGLSGIWYGV